MTSPTSVEQTQPFQPVFKEVSGPSWPPASPGSSVTKLRQPDNHRASSSSDTAAELRRVVTRKLVPQESQQVSAVINTRDELLISLLASEALVDSRAFQILTAEEVEELKKVCIYTSLSLYFHPEVGT